MLKRTLQDDFSLARHVLLCLPFVSTLQIKDPEPWGAYYLVCITIRHKWYIRWFGDTKPYDELASQQIHHLGDMKVIYEINGVVHPPF